MRLVGTLPLLGLVLGLLGGGAASVACAPKSEFILRTADGREVTEAEVDEDPWALLPSGAVTWAEIDAKKLFSSSFGQEASALLTEHLPLARGAGFDAVRDVERVHLGVYATVGADTAAVLRGHFDRAKIQSAVRDNPTASHGRPIVTTKFAGFEVYVVEGAAMALVTDRTMVAGTEIGVRRVLERIEEARLRAALPPWFQEMRRARAPIALGVDLDAQPVPATVRTRLGFLSGLRAARLLGNFESPGLNLAGTLTYDTEDSATKAAESLEAEVDRLDRYALVLSLLKIPRPIRRLETKATAESTQVVVEIEGQAMSALLARFDQLLAQAF